MVASITLFANNASPTGPQLDGNFQSYTPLTIIPCVVSGSNSITLTPSSGSAGATPSITAYQNYMQFSGVVAISNTAATQMRVGSLALLNAYKDTALGPVQLSGAELIAGCAFTALYDSALNSGAGGFHVTTGPNTVGATLNVTQLTATTINGTNIGATNFSAVSLASVGKLAVGATLTTVTRINSALGTLSYSITPANTVQDQTFPVAGAVLGDTVDIGWLTAPPAGAGFTGFLAASGTVTLRLSNPSTVTLGAASVTVRAAAMGFT